MDIANRREYCIDSTNFYDTNFNDDDDEVYDENIYPYLYIG